MEYCTALSEAVWGTVRFGMTGEIGWDFLGVMGRREVPGEILGRPSLEYRILAVVLAAGLLSVRRLGKRAR